MAVAVLGVDVAGDRSRAHDQRGVPGVFFHQHVPGCVAAVDVAAWPLLVVATATAPTPHTALADPASATLTITNVPER